MNIAIVDDDIEQLDVLTKQIGLAWRKWDDGKLTAFSNVMELYPLVSVYDIVFMDIKMPDKNGITAAIELGKISPRLIIVFLSDYDSYVWDSFQANPVYYLRKSHLQEELPFVLEKCIQTYQARNQTVIIVGMHESFQCNIQDLYYVETQGKYVLLHFDCHTKSIKTTFSNVEQSLKSPQFLKIHRCYLVNSAHIRSMQNKLVVLDNEETLPVSKYRYETVHTQYLMSLL